MQIRGYFIYRNSIKYDGLFYSDYIKRRAIAPYINFYTRAISVRLNAIANVIETVLKVMRSPMYEG
ncbi:MAG: hypothetical protein V7K98_19050 [Nostoc sp.]|uniref:hypothetical protein n=1 Tax=Nostoc sp. TaxID=1180 RepID=UPI002FFBCF91